jgi:hydroxymethylpyrimidine/phosphomethylpyrimidine kinase
MSINPNLGRILIVAGSDSGGGAGIQADIKTVTALGGYAATAITAVTNQNTIGVHGIHAVSPDFIGQQIHSVLTDIGADVIKTGMLASAEIVNAVAKALTDFGKNIPRVVDPVMVAKGGQQLIDTSATEVLIKKLIVGAAVVTPNLPEAEVLTGRSIKTESDMEDALPDLVALGAQAVVLKGGHLEGDSLVDLLIQNGQIERFEGPRIASTSTHGTGCTLASAIAAGLAQGLSLYDSVARARRYVFDAIKSAPGFGQGHGPLNHAHTVQESWTTTVLKA